MRLASLAVMAALFFARGARADEQAVRLEFEASGGCPGRPEFMAQVHARTERVHFVEAAPDAGPTTVRELKVTAGPEGDRAVGRLRVGATEDADRLVTGKTCADVISALALIAAVAIDPAASQAAIETPIAVSLPSPPPPPLEDNANDSRRLAAPAPDVATAPSPSAERTRAKWPWFGGGGARGEVSHGFGSGTFTLLGASIYGEAGLALGETWRPTLRLSAMASWSPTVEPDAQPNVGAANLRLIAGRLALCPIAYRVRESFVVRPCASFELGRLDATAKAVPNGQIIDARAGHMTRVALGQSIQARVRVVSSLWMELEIGANEPLLRQKFVFSMPDVTVSAVSAVEIAVGAGLGVHFP